MRILTGLQETTNSPGMPFGVVLVRIRVRGRECVVA